MKINLRRNWGWVITGASFLHFFANYGFLYSYGQLLVIFQHEFGKGATMTGWLGTVPFGLTYLASPVSNLLISRFEHRPTAILDVVMCFVSLIVTSFMTSLIPMIFTFSLLYGFGINFVTVSALNILLKYFPEKHSARSVTITLMGCNAGLLAMNPVVYELNTSVGWRNMMRVAAAFILLSGIGASSTFRNPSRHASRLPEEKAGKTDRMDGERKAHLSSELDRNGCVVTLVAEREKLKSKGYELELSHDVKTGDCEGLRQGPRPLSVLRYPELWLTAVGLITCSAAVSFFYMSLVAFLVSRGFSDETSALVMTALGISQVVGKLLVAAVGDHLPFPKIFTLVMADVVGAILISSLLVIRTLVPTLCVTIASGVVVISILDTLPHTISYQMFHSNLRVVSWTVCIASMGTGYVVGALLGESIDRTGSYDGALYVCMGLFLFSGLLFSLVPCYQVRFARDRFVMFRTNKESETDVDVRVSVDEPSSKSSKLLSDCEEKMVE